MTPSPARAELQKTAPSEAEIENAIQALSLDEKVRLLSGAAQFAFAGEDRIDLAPIILSDGPTGVRGEVVVGGRESCLLPNASLLAQTWNPNALDEAAGVLAEEAIDQETHVVLGPTINLHRSPLGGRLFEAFSEDPLLTARLASAYVDGLQRHGVSSSVKHFIGNESETERTTVNSVIAEEALREVYLAPFQIVLEDANPWTLMASYNRVNGVAATEHRELLNDVVKEEWDYDGLIVSDWYAVQTTEESVTAGLDVVMPGPATVWAASLADAVRAGRVAEEVVDEHVRRVLRLAARVGAFGEHRAWPEVTLAPADAKRREQLTRLAAEGMVVLKNRGNILPLRLDELEQVAVVGRHALDTIAQGGGSAQVRPPHIVHIADGLRDVLGAERLTVIDGVETRTTLPAAATSRVRHPATGRPGIRVRVFDAIGTLLHDVHRDVAEIEDSQDGWLADAATIELSATIDVAEPTEVQLGVRGPGDWKITASGYSDEYQIPFHKGPGGGFFRPKSHATTVLVEPGTVVTATTSRTEMPRILGLVISEARRSSATVIAAAANAARAADLAVVVVGFTPDQETEGLDKTTLRLPGDQDALVAAVASAAKKTVVVVNAATPALMPWAELVDAILFAGLPGQESGTAVAAALTGAVLPEGRLVTTFPAHDRQGPAWSTSPVDGDLPYEDGTFIGHRGWLASGEAPAFWFGFGLGLTDWEYLDAEVLSRSEDDLTRGVRVRVRNVGESRGRETVQVYLEPEQPGQPIRLIGWAQTLLDPGADGLVTVECDARLQRRWDSSSKKWVPLAGGRLLIGRSAGDVRVTL